jgi:hypothetical protein
MSIELNEKIISDVRVVASDDKDLRVPNRVLLKLALEEVRAGNAKASV